MIDRARLEKRAESAGSYPEIGFEYPLELEDRLLIESDSCEVTGADTRIAKAPLEGAHGEGGIALDAGEALLGSSRDNVAVPQERNSAVMVEG